MHGSAVALALDRTCRNDAIQSCSATEQRCIEPVTTGRRRQNGPTSALVFDLCALSRLHVALKSLASDSAPELAWIFRSKQTRLNPLLRVVEPTPVGGRCRGKGDSADANHRFDSHPLCM